MAMPSFPSPINTSSNASIEMSETIVPRTFSFPAFGTNCSISAVHAFSGPSFYSTVKSEAMSVFGSGQPTSVISTESQETSATSTDSRIHDVSDSNGSIEQ